MFVVHDAIWDATAQVGLDSQVLVRQEVPLDFSPPPSHQL